MLQLLSYITTLVAPLRGARSTPPRSAAAIALESVTLANAAGDSAQIYTFGACVTSYVKDGRDVLMVRPDAKMDGSKPISGGIPFCFPQFGPGEMQQHGFARNLEWSIASSTADTAVFTLADSDYTRAMWPHAFSATYTVSLGATSLSTEFKVRNLGDAPFEFTGALHSYWAVSGIANVAVRGAFEGASYLDKMIEPPALVTSSASTVTITEETDRVFEGVSGDVVIEDSGAGSALTIRSSGWEDTVLWNPYGNEGMGYDSFVCVAAATALSPVTLPAQAEWTGTMEVIPGSL